MDKKTKILNSIFWGMVVLSLSITFYKTIIKQDFVIINYEDESKDETSKEDSEIQEETEENIKQNI